MRILLINAVCGTGSTGRICADLARQFESEGHTVKIAYGRSGYVPKEYKKYAVRIGTSLGVRLHGIKTRIFDTHGLGSRLATRHFLKWAEVYQPDFLWLHNIHGYYINYEMLFGWIKAHPEMQVKWTLHDCWAFTGHCAYFTAIGCEQWKEGCLHCPQKSSYPRSFLRSNSNENFERKKKAFCNVSKMTLVVPSNWLAQLTKQSFLREYPVEVRRNTIDTHIFHPTASDFRHRYGIEDKKVILGVANVWDERKGFLDFIRLSEMLEPSYVIVVVGLSNVQRKQLRANMIGIPRTKNSLELAPIYSAADVFFNPTYEDNYSTVNLEAQACGIPVVTYDSGGSSETLHLSESVAVTTGDLDKSLQFLMEICERQNKH